MHRSVTDLQSLVNRRRREGRAAELDEALAFAPEGPAVRSPKLGAHRDGSHAAPPLVPHDRTNGSSGADRASQSN